MVKKYEIDLTDLFNDMRLAYKIGRVQMGGDDPEFEFSIIVDEDEWDAFTKIFTLSFRKIIREKMEVYEDPKPDYLSINFNDVFDNLDYKNFDSKYCVAACGEGNQLEQVTILKEDKNKYLDYLAKHFRECFESYMEECDD